MAATYKACQHCDTPTRRRCRDCKRPVCMGCVVHEQCENCVDAETFNQTSRYAHGNHDLRCSHYIGQCDQSYHGRCSPDVA